jgi:hypothetical protein
VHLNGGAGIALVSQLSTHVQIQYVAGDNNGVALVHVDGLDTSGSVHVQDWKAERWNSGTPGHPDVFLINNGNGALVDLGQGRVHVGSGVTAGTNLIHQTAGAGASVARVKWRMAYHNVDGSPDYTNGYRDDFNNITLTVAQATRATVAMNEPYGALAVGTATKIAEAVGGAAIYQSTVSPNGSLAANPGSLCMITSGVTYYKRTGTGNTGWVLIGSNGTTANRPAASSVGAGGEYYDTTLSKPIWSDGTTWRDAVGTAA